jgi:hypothetical protein
LLKAEGDKLKGEIGSVESEAIIAEKTGMDARCFI